ncbi:MAG: DMT family transporter [Alphaproteobacteria bacterium]|nr:DMT family transporter [Alphaproteobacteria bacterium]
MDQRKTHLDALASLMLLVCCMFWGAQQVLVKATLPDVPPIWQAALRFVGATLLLLLWMRWRGLALWLRDGTGRAGLAVGLLFTCEFVCIYVGMQYTTASRLTIFLYTAPFWVAMLLPLWVKSERMHPGQWLGLVLAFASVGYALRDGLLQPGLPTQWWGDVLALGAGAFWGLTTVAIRSTSLARVSPERLLLYQIANCALVLPVLAFLAGENLSLDLSAWAWGSLGIQALVGAFLSYLVWMWLLGRYPATRLSTFAFLTPVFALICGTLWLGEPLTQGLLVALLGVAAGIVLVNRRPV